MSLVSCSHSLEHRLLGISLRAKPPEHHCGEWVLLPHVLVVQKCQLTVRAALMFHGQMRLLGESLEAKQMARQVKGDVGLLVTFSRTYTT